MSQTPHTHPYRIHLEWTGNTGAGTAAYAGYERSHRISAPGKPDLAGSSDVSFRGEASRYNPEELFVASLSACHMLWYLHLCAEAGIVVTAYRDRAQGVLALEPGGSGRFREVVLHPEVTVRDPEMRAGALALHEEAHARCFIARSVNFPVTHQATATALP